MEKQKRLQLNQELGELLTDKNDPEEVRESLSLMLDFATDPHLHKADDGYLTVEFMNGIDILRRIVQTIESQRS